MNHSNPRGQKACCLPAWTMPAQNLQACTSQALPQPKNKFLCRLQNFKSRLLGRPVPWHVQTAGVAFVGRPAIQQVCHLWAAARSGGSASLLSSFPLPGHAASLVVLILLVLIAHQLIKLQGRCWQEKCHASGGWEGERWAARAGSAHTCIQSAGQATCSWPRGTGGSILTFLAASKAHSTGEGTAHQRSGWQGSPSPGCTGPTGRRRQRWRRRRTAASAAPCAAVRSPSRSGLWSICWTGQAPKRNHGAQQVRAERGGRWQCCLSSSLPVPKRPHRSC